MTIEQAATDFVIHRCHATACTYRAVAREYYADEEISVGELDDVYEES